MLRRRIDVILSLILVAVLFGVATSLGFSALDSVRGYLPSATIASSPNLGFHLVHILMRNVPAATFLFSGLATAGLSSLVGIALIGSFAGATTAASGAAIGLASTLGSVAIYAPIEFAGFFLAGAAGILPTVRAALNQSLPQPSPYLSFHARYRGAFSVSLLLFLISLLILAVAAYAEAAVIVTRRG